MTQVPKTSCTMYMYITSEPIIKQFNISNSIISGHAQSTQSVIIIILVSINQYSVPLYLFAVNIVYFLFFSVLFRHFTPAIDRQRPYTIERVLLLPPSSRITLSVQFLRAFLKWDEYPPDASHGFYVK